MTNGFQEIEEFELSQKQVNAFADAIDDHNPIHHDIEYAKNTIFKRPIVHGFYGGSIFSKMLANKLWGPGTIYLSQDLRFCKPMFVDTKYKVILTVKETDNKKHRAFIQTQIFDGEDLVIDGEALIQHKDIV
jgi:acyl dehydratase|tara:strand:- start:311 stop:706 length:396 start_codon:yes stop_codon:yes gene_type:complete